METRPSFPQVPMGADDAFEALANLLLGRAGFRRIGEMGVNWTCYDGDHNGVIIQSANDWLVKEGSIKKKQPLVGRLCMNCGREVIQRGPTLTAHFWDPMFRKLWSQKVGLTWTSITRAEVELERRSLRENLAKSKRYKIV
jgi:hypothetical protein